MTGQENKKNIKELYRIYCPICKRFLLKISIEKSTSINFLSLPCPNCKHSIALKLKNQTLNIKTTPSKQNSEPEGSIENSILKKYFDHSLKFSFKN